MYSSQQYCNVPYLRLYEEVSSSSELVCNANHHLCKEAKMVNEANVIYFQDSAWVDRAPLAGDNPNNEIKFI